MFFDFFNLSALLIKRASTQLNEFCLYDRFHLFK